MDVQRYKSLAGSLDPAAINAQTIKFRSTLKDLDKEKAKFITGGKGGFVATVQEAAHYYVILVLYIVGPIFSTILIANTFYSNHKEIFLANIFYKLFYAFWAAVWYPIILLYGCIDPPIFRALFPLIPKSPSEQIWHLIAYHVPVGIEDPITSEKGKIVVRLFSILLFSFFLYAFIFYSGTAA